MTECIDTYCTETYLYSVMVGKSVVVMTGCSRYEKNHLMNFSVFKHVVTPHFIINLHLKLLLSVFRLTNLKVKKIAYPDDHIKCGWRVDSHNWYR